ncbi:hypothetical protein KKA33_01545 [Patescibacteria group bacterium]|nr:hypothetical protein [Patescibacteria group bacterium]
MDYKAELKNALHIALLKKNVMHHIAGDKSKTKFGYYVIIAAAIFGIIGQQLFMSFFRPSLTFSLLNGVIQIVSVVIGIYVLSFIAKSIFKGQAKHDAFFRVMAYGMIVTWLAILPQIAIISGIWGLVLVFVILTTIHKLTAGGAIGTILVAVIAMLVVSMILTPLYALLGFGAMGGGSFNLNGGKTGTMDFNRGGGFQMNVPGEDGGTVQWGEGGMKVTTPEGEVMEINIPNFE